MPQAHPKYKMREVLRIAVTFNDTSRVGGGCILTMGLEPHSPVAAGDFKARDVFADIRSARSPLARGTIGRAGTQTV
jgi:hypothetical protein